MLGVFLDECGTQAWSSVTVVAGLLGSENQWSTFTTAWNARLAEPLPGKPSIRRFRLSCCRSGDDEFRDYGAAERDRVAQLFRRIILDVGLITTIVAVNRVAWDELLTGNLTNLVGTPAEFCFTKCVALMIDAMRMKKQKEKMFILVDQETATQPEVWAKLYKSQYNRSPEIAGMGFAPASNVAALQGVNMVAVESQLYARAWLRARDRSINQVQFNEYFQTELSVGLMIDREHIEELAAKTRSDIARV
jgi:hypothetical protein